MGVWKGDGMLGKRRSARHLNERVGVVPRYDLKLRGWFPLEEVPWYFIHRLLAGGNASRSREECPGLRASLSS